MQEANWQFAPIITIAIAKLVNIYNVNNLIWAQLHDISILSLFIRILDLLLFVIISGKFTLRLDISP